MVQDEPGMSFAARGLTDWDDVRHFLAVARGGSVRAAAARLGVNHATLLRRIARLEQQLGTRLFERLPSGYRVTAAGAEVHGLAERMEASARDLESRVMGRDRSLAGLLRVTMAPTLASHLLMPDLAAFAEAHPAIELAVLSQYEPVNLTNREADVAVRVVYDRNALPPNLHGLEGPHVYGGVYLSRGLLAAWRTGTVERIRWIVRDSGSLQEPEYDGAIPMAGPPFRTTDAAAQIAAVRLGLGVTPLPCFVGDGEPELARAPGTRLRKLGTLWLLTQGETRKTERVRRLTAFLAERLAAHAPRLAGEAVSERTTAVTE